MVTRASESKVHSTTTQAANHEEVCRALDRILSSKYFIHAPKKQKFLHLICDFYLNGRAAELNEYLIGREVFDRDEHYNPAADPIVRVGAHDVRKKLELYYQNEGANDEIRLGIPVGSYEPNFIRQRTEPVSAASRAVASESFELEPALIGRIRLRLLGGAFVVLILALVVLILSNLDLRRQVREATASKDRALYGPVWEPFLKGSDPTLLVLSNPPVYRFLNAGDPEVLTKKSIGLMPEQANELTQALEDKFIIRNTPNPRLILGLNDYTGMGEAIGLYRITDLLRTAGKDLLLKQSRTVSAEDLKNHHVITLGSIWTNEWSGKLPIQEDFIYTGNATIENRNPLPGEEREYRSRFNEQTGKLIEDYALVTVKPNITSENTVMVLAGIRSPGTDAAVEYVTAKKHLNELNERLRQLGGRAGPFKYYQALLKVGVEDSIPTTISLVTLHESRKPER
jgi:hypothetical protein